MSILGRIMLQFLRREVINIKWTMEMKLFYIRNAQKWAEFCSNETGSLD